MMETARKRKGMDIDAITEGLYLFIAAAYVLKTSFDTTLFHISWPENYGRVLRISACVLLLLKIYSNRTYIEKKLLVCVLTGILFILSWKSTGYAFLLDIAMLTAGAVNIPYKKILKTVFWIGLYVLLLAMLGSFTGCIADLVYSKMSGVFKHSFGVVYPTDFAAHVVFLSLAGWVLYGRRFLIRPVICILGLAAYVYYYCNAKCSTAVLLLQAAAVVYYFFTEKYTGTKKFICSLKKRLDKVLPYVMPAGAVLAIGLTFLYDSESVWMSRINNLLNSRLNLGQEALDAYGIKLFGTAFDLIGAGGEITTRLDYNFVDISYVLILVRYGLAVLLAFCIHYICLEHGALKNGHRKLAIAAALIAFHSMIEHHLPEAAYNVFLMLPFADFSCYEHNGRAERAAGRHKKNVLFWIKILITSAAVWALPRAVGYMKTLVDLLHLDSPENNILFIGILTAVFSAAGSCLWMLSGVAGALIRKDPLPKVLCAGLAASVLVLLCGIVKGEQIIRRGAEENQDILAADSLAIEALLASKEPVGRLYIDYIPEIYRREFGNISFRVLPAEGAATQADVTLFTEDDRKLKALIYAGFEYGETAPGHAVYTNNEAAGKILEDIGVKLTPYYSRQYSAAPDEIALWNGLGMTEDGRLVVSGAAQSLTHGPGITVYGGKLQVSYQLQLIGSTAEEGLAATVKITSEGGRRILKQEDISLADFDKNGRCSYAVTMFLYSNYPDVEFMLLIPDGVTMEVQEIRYGEVE